MDHFSDLKIILSPTKKRFGKLSTYFFTSWTEHVHTTQKIHKIKAQLQTQFCLAILKLNIDLSTMDEKKNANVHSGVYHFAKNYR